ncbi:MAG TPA: proton-conducting transporter membrane subunit [Candidatus Limnocylindrales bacterium]|jgi:NADH:ubiquinone oxidoreductase subunit 2 (subunit N)
MTLFAFLLAAATGGGGVVALRERPKAAATVGLLATGICLVAAVAMNASTSLAIGSTTLQVDAYVRLFLVAASVGLLVSQVVGLAHGWQRELPLATLGALGLIGVALTVHTPAAAMLTVAAAGTFVVIASLERAVSMPAVRAAASGFRLAVIAGFMGLVAMAITGDDPIFMPPDVLAGATLLMAAAVAIRIGAIPFHAPLARLIERAKTTALPLLAAWVPAAFAVIALGWTATIVSLGTTTPIAIVVMAVGVLTITLASAVVLIDDDLVRWLGYGIIADGGFVLLALAGDSVGAIASGLTWLVCFALARTIAACVILGLQGAYDARRTRELEGWLRRTPLLGAALIGAMIIGFGIPGTLSWQVRLDLAQGALGEVLGMALVLIALLPLLPMARLAWVGVLRPGNVVAAGTSERFLLPPGEPDLANTSGVEAETAPTAGAERATIEPLADAGPLADAEVRPDASVPDAGSPADVPAVLDVAQVTAVTPMDAAASEPAPGPEPSISPDAASDTLWASADASAGADRTEQDVAPVAADADPRTTDDRAASTAPEPAQVSAAEPVSATMAASSPDPMEATPGSPPTGHPTAEVEQAPGATLSSRGRAARAARKAGQPTVVVAQPAEGEGDRAADGVPPPAAEPPAAGGPSRGERSMASLRRAAASASTSAGPLRRTLDDLPAVWALDRTLIASIATLVLALVGLAFATDLVGLAAAAGAAAGVGVEGSPAP